MRIVCWQTILMKYRTLFFFLIWKDVAKFAICCSCNNATFCGMKENPFADCMLVNFFLSSADSFIFKSTMVFQKILQSNKQIR